MTGLFIFTFLPKMCCSSESRSIEQASVLPHNLFQNVKDTDYTDLPGGMTGTITSRLYDMEYFFPLQILRHTTNPLEVLVFELYTEIFYSFSHRVVAGIKSLCSQYT